MDESNLAHLLIIMNIREIPCFMACQIHANPRWAVLTRMTSVLLSSMWQQDSERSNQYLLVNFPCLHDIRGSNLIADGLTCLFLLGSNWNGLYEMSTNNCLNYQSDWNNFSPAIPMTLTRNFVAWIRWPRECGTCSFRSNWLRRTWSAEYASIQSY